MFFDQLLRLIDPIKDEKTVREKYRYWRIRTFYGMYVGYALFYFTRKSLACALPSMKGLGYDEIWLGTLASILFISYGVSKFLSGMLGDRSNPRYFMAIGLIMTGLSNILFGLSSYWLLFAFFWGLNGVFQGWGWPSCAKLLTHWYSHSERGRWWGFWNTSHNLGGFLISWIGAACLEYMGWRYALYVPGVLCILGGFFLINRLRDTPVSLGLPPIEKYRQDYTSDTEDEGSSGKAALSTKELLFEYVLKNRFMWMLGVSYFFVYVIRNAVDIWGFSYLIANDYSKIASGFCYSLFEVGGFFGSLAAGWASDKVFNGRRTPVNIIFTLMAVSSALGMWLFAGTHVLMDGFFICSIGFFIFGPQMLIGIAAAELSHKKAAGTSTGFVGCFAYLSALIIGAPLGGLIKTWGWEAFFILLAVCGIIASMLMAPMWSIRSSPKEEKLVA